MPVLPLTPKTESVSAAIGTFIDCYVWGCMKYELQQMRKQGSCIIVNCSSLGGIVDGP